MRLNHIDLATPDLAATRDFLVEHLDFICLETRGQDGLAVLKDPTGLVLVLSRLRRTGAQAYPEGFHVGFHLESEAAVHGLHARLKAAGHPVGDPPRMEHGALGFYFDIPGGILTEVAYRG